MKKTLFFITSILIILLITSVNAVGISKFYYTGQPLKIGAGESKSVPVALFMASQETQDRKLITEMVNDAGIAKLIDPEIRVPAGSINKEIKLRFSIEEGVPEGTEHIITLRVKDETVSSESGMIGFNSVKMVSFPVLVTAPEKPETNFLMWSLFILIVLLIIVILYIVLKRRNIKSLKKTR